MIDRVSTLGLTASLVLRAINKSLRWKKIGLYSAGEYWSEGSPVILAFWHSDQLMMPWVYFPDAGKAKMRPLHALISLHSDGRIAAKTLDWLKVTSIGGSSTRGGARALLTLKRSLKDGNHVAITPDGPKGPKNLVKQGVVALSSISGFPILPVAVAAKHVWKFRSWDGMFLPKPFSKIAAIAGGSVSILPNLSSMQMDSECERLTDCLNGLKRDAEALL